ncbi:unnamed protein product [Sphagnum balticum]
MNAAVLFKPNHKPREREIDWLPKSLETLELVNYDQYAVDQLLQILKARQEVVLKLVQVQLRRRIVDADDDDDEGEDGDDDEQETRLARFERAVEDLKECKDAAITLEFFEEETVQAVDNHSTIWTRIE